MSQQTAPPPLPKHDETTLADVKQLGLWAAIASLSYVFWVCGGMEMVERLAFYGVRAVATLYATRPVSAGGLGVTMATFGTLLLFWNLVQSLIPVFTGGLSDRYGYKQTIFASTVIKSLGYLVMAWFHSYWGFFCGAMLLATGTAIFKPGVQGTLIKGDQPPQQLHGLGHLLPDREHRRLDWPAHRPANAADGLEIRLLHQCRGHLLQLPPPAHLS